MKMPLVSIIIPVYQVEKYIEASIKSICFQSYTNIEIILVDDGSKDSSIFIARKVLQEYPSLKYKMIVQENKGVAAARNAGLKAAEGEWVICIDPDDVIAEDFIYEMVAALNQYEDVDFVMGNYQVVWDGRTPELKPEKEMSRISRFTKKEFFDLFLYRKIPVIEPAILIKKEFLSKHRIYHDESIRFSEDLQFIWQLVQKSTYILYIYNKRYFYIKHPNSTMTSSDFNKIMTGYQGLLRYCDNIPNGGGDLIMSRWVFGVVHSSARMLLYQSYSVLLDKMDYKNYLRKLYHFKDFKVRILSRIFCTSKKLTYRICRII